jgi:hypothetical protein
MTVPWDFSIHRQESTGGELSERFTDRSESIEVCPHPETANQAKSHDYYRATQPRDSTRFSTVQFRCLAFK